MDRVRAAALARAALAGRSDDRYAFGAAVPVVGPWHERCQRLHERDNQGLVRGGTGVLDVPFTDVLTLAQPVAISLCVSAPAANHSAWAVFGCLKFGVSARACPHLSQERAQTRWSAARKFLAVFS